MSPVSPVAPVPPGPPVSPTGPSTPGSPEGPVSPISPRGPDQQKKTLSHTYILVEQIYRIYNRCSFECGIGKYSTRPRNNV